MNTTHTTLLCLTLLLNAGASPARSASVPEPPARVVPGFRVQISYSPKAALELKRRGETVVILGNTYGDAAKNAPRRIVDETGEIDLGKVHAEIQPGAIANLPTLTLNANNLPYLTPAGVQLLINVISGRKSSPNNLLDCDIYQGPLRKVQSQTIPIHCKLIAEGASLTGHNVN